MGITQRACITCKNKIHTIKSLPCGKHILQLNNREPFLCAVSCTFFSELASRGCKIEDNEEFYHQSESNTTVSSQISSYVCTKCREPFLEMAKMKIKYEQSQQKLKEIVNNINVMTEDNSKKEGRKVPVLCENPNKENKTAFQNQQVCRKLQYIEKETRPAKELKAHQFQVKDVLDEILEETKSEEDLFVGIEKQSSLGFQKMSF